MVSMQISLSLVGSLRARPVAGRRRVKSLAALRDEGFRRVWMAQMPYDPTC